MKTTHIKVRRWILAGLTLGIFGVFAARLMDIQIVQADEIRRQLEIGSISKQTVKATRGEIVDRNGVSMVSNKLGYDVVIDKVFFPRQTQNDIILQLIALFEENGESWNDNLPITKTAPFQFASGYDTDAAANRLKDFLEIQSYSSAEEAMYWLIDRYRLEEYSQADARKIAGVRYEMDQRGFAINIPYTFASDIDISLVLQIKEHGYQLSGVDVQESALRNYDMGSIAPHLIGRVGPIFQEEWEGTKEQPGYRDKGYSLDDIVGKSGAELSFEEELRGQHGERLISLDSGGRVTSVEEAIPAVPGHTIVLTIDTELQDLLQRLLEAQIKRLQETANPGQGREADYGAAVVLNNKTGELLAYATYPSYDLNTFAEDYSTLANDPGLPLYNRAFQGLYAPGSTFKPVVATAALASGQYTKDTAVTCTHVYHRFSDYQPRCLGTHGPINLRRALSVSCNIYFYDVGWNIGVEAMDATARQYGLGEPTGIELAELVGQRSNPETAERSTGEKWSNGNVLQTAIGQLAAQYTPLQLANYAATIANRGDRMKVSVVKEIRDYARDQVLQPFQPVVADRVSASRSNFEDVIEGMVEASRTGSAVAHFGNYPFDVASKTGTPETSEGAFPNSTFICFGPAADPEITVAVVIEKGWHGYTSAPVARGVFDWYFDVPNPNPLVTLSSPDEALDDGSRTAQASGAEQAANSAAAGTEPSSEQAAEATADPLETEPTQPQSAADFVQDEEEAPSNDAASPETVA